ncbi:MAG: hypothetical protein PHV59_11120 [Victivallales bacterium]|nr:hypothetical protein [Victivallales bacterium]
MNKRLFFDEDDSARFITVEAGTLTAEHLDRIVDGLSNTQVTDMVIGVNAAKVNYPSAVWESQLENFDMKDGLEQPYWNEPLSVAFYRRSANLQVLLEHGIDSNRHLLKKAAGSGLQPWLTIRMNDVHDAELPEFISHPEFWKNNPQLWISEEPYENGFNYSHAEIREYMLALIKEVVERYNPPGLVLDWTRFPLFFPVDKGYGQRHLITGMVKTIREYAPAIKILMRLPATIDDCLQRGLDPLAWARMKLVDVIAPAPFINTNFDLPVEAWRAALDEVGSNIPIMAGCVRTLRDYPGCESYLASPEQLRGFAMTAWDRGADGIYMFNMMGWQFKEEFRHVFSELGNPETMLGKDRSYVLTWDDMELSIGQQDKCYRVKGYFDKWYAERLREGNYSFALPALIKASEQWKFKFHIGPKPEPELKSGMVMNLRRKIAPSATVQLLINGKATVTAKPDGNKLRFYFDKGLLNAGYNHFSITNDTGEPIEVLHVVLEFKNQHCR